VSARLTRLWARIKRLGVALGCLFGNHSWTCKADEGIQPSGAEMPRPGDSGELVMLKFRLYSQMYCKHCGRPSRYSL